ncbi:hypothetical protein V8C42DRAFT_328680 [Trichoderma barbatum]
MQNPPVDSSNRPISRHSWSSTQLLKQWYTSNSAWPYPTAEFKEELSHRTGLSVRQVSQWFVNARRRSAEKRSSEPVDDSNSPKYALIPQTSDAQQEEKKKVEAANRVRGSSSGSSSGERSASLGAVSQVVVQDPLVQIDSQGDTPANASAASSYSSSHSRDFDHTTHRPRRNRRTVVRHTATDRPEEDQESRVYQCTFCTDTFKSRYDWTRHEGTLHLALERWTCLPSGSKRWDLGDAAPRCSMCDSSDPTDAHLESHHISDCVIKPFSLRTFHRKDHLHQHLRLAHNIDKMIPSMKSWKSKISEVKSRCGFCGQTFSLWSDRNDHLSDHFKRGESMKDWKGDRGLEPSVAMLVQSAIPPYLIGTEAADLEPFSASKGVMKKILSSPEKQNLPNVFEVLTARLGDFVTSARANGKVINCDILRREARLILYGDDDPLNQTPADNEQWLTLFKIGHGLASASNQQHSAPSVPDDASAAASTPNVATPMLADTGNLTLLHEASVGNSGSNSTRRIPDGVESKLPWWCQTPECLAELMQMSQEFSLTSLGDIEIDDESVSRSKPQG